jgi:hypothetical protein
LTAEQKAERLENSYQAWISASDVKKKERGMVAVGRFDALVRRWFLRVAN